MNRSSQKRKRNTKARYSPEERRKGNSDQVAKEGKANDPMWYVIDEQMARDVGSLSFNNSLGNPIIFNNEDGFTTKAPSYRYGAIPGIFNIFTTPAIGFAGSEVDGVNIAAKNIYSYVRHDNSGHANYDSPDLMIYLLAMDSIYSYAACLMRIYGIAQVYSQKNKYLGAALIRSMGVDPDDVMLNLSNFRAYINIFITKMGTMCIPAIMTYYLRHLWMYSNVFMDENISKASLYMYIPATLFKYDTSGASALMAEPIFRSWNSTNGFVAPASLLTVNQLVGFAENLLNPIIASEDLNIMSGDILKAFGKENLFRMPLVPTEYATLPIYSDEVLYQIHNTQFASSIPVNLSLAPSLDSLNVIQDTSIGSGNLLFMPKFRDVAHLSLTRVMDFYKEDVSPTDVIVASRNMLSGEIIDDPTINASAITSCGSEICLFAQISKFTAAGAFNNEIWYNGGTLYSGASESYTVSKFNFAPLAILKFSTGAYAGLAGDLGNYTMISKDTVKKLHDSAILSMFGVPKLGNANG